MPQRQGLELSNLPSLENIKELFHPVFVVGIGAPELDELVLSLNHKRHHFRSRESMGPIDVQKLYDRQSFSREH
jgi:hypothetical protein